MHHLVSALATNCSNLRVLHLVLPPKYAWKWYWLALETGRRQFHPNEIPGLPSLLLALPFQTVRIDIRNHDNKRSVCPAAVLFESFLSPIIQQWPTLRNLRLTCSHYLKVSRSDGGIIKVKSDSLETLSLEYFSPWKTTQYDLRDCPKLKKYTILGQNSTRHQTALGMEDDSRCHLYTKSSSS